MIVNIRGTHGSGKSTVVRRFIGEDREPIWKERRKQPLGYHCRGGKLFVPGHYEGPCGGCDSIVKVDMVYDMIKGYADKGWNVLFEGILAQHSTPRILALKPYDLTVIVLTTPLDVCIAAVQSRRDERGDTKPFDPKNLIRENKAVQSAMRRLKAAGVKVLELSRDQALEHLQEQL